MKRTSQTLILFLSAALCIAACKKENHQPVKKNSTDATSSWTDIKFQGQADGGISAMMVAANGRIFAGLGVTTGIPTSLYFSTDTGKTWHQSDSLHNAKINGYVFFIKQNPATGVILMGCNAHQINGLFYSGDGGANWTNNPHDFLAWDIAFMNNKTYIATGNGVGPILGAAQYMVSSTDDFVSQWTDCSNYNTVQSGYRLFTDNNTLFVAEISHGALFRSTDPESKQYTPTDAGITYPNQGTSYVKRMVKAGNYLFTGTTDGIFRSSDGGNNWTKCNLGFTSSANDFAVIGNDIYVALKDSAVYKSSDNGTSWQAYHKGLTLPLTAKCIQASGNYLIAGDDNTKIYRIKTK